MPKKSILFLLIALFISSLLWALPESPHPYPNDYDQTIPYSIPGALGLEITFSPQTATEAEQDFIIIQDGNKQEIAKFSGNSLARNTVYVEGDIVYIRLVTDDNKTAYGYQVTQIRALMTRKRTAVQYNYSKCTGLSNQALKNELYDMVKNHTCLGYTQARTKMFSEIDNINGYVRCVYTAREVHTNGIPDANDMNTEHTWPKSQGAGSDPAKSDLFHLFPTDSYTNSKRSSYPFGDVVYVDWSKGGSSLGKNSGQYMSFMPREDHRGNVARAMFYFSIRYRNDIPGYEEVVLKRWNQEDPVDATERSRNDAISGYQKNRNPFIDHPEYADQIDDF